MEKSEPPRIYTSDEGFSTRPDGTRDDYDFHASIMDNPEAERLIARWAVEDAIARGMTPEAAEQLYGYRGLALE